MRIAPDTAVGGVDRPQRDSGRGGLPGQSVAEHPGGDPRHRAAEPFPTSAAAHRFAPGSPRIGEVEILHLHDSGRSYLIEINARPWLQYALAPATGHDFLGLMLGTESAAALNLRRERKTWINLRGDIRHRRLGFGAYLRSLARSNVYAVFDLRDPMPFVHALRKWRAIE